MSDARGFWIKQDGRLQLCWQIDGAFITDATLRRWVYHANPDAGSHVRYVGPCILQCHVDQWAKSQFGVSPTPSGTAHKTEAVTE